MEQNSELDLDLREFDEEAKIEYLKNISHSHDVETVRRDIPEDIKEQLKDFVVEESTSIMEKSAEMKEIVKDFQAALKKHKEGVYDALGRIKRGYTENEEPVYNIDDQDNGIMKVYDKEGKLLYQRKLKPSEKQTRVLSMRTGTND